MKETAEREVKLTPEDGFVLPELGGEALPTRRFVSTYHDTPDLVLARHGITLRHRTEDGSGLWQLKLPKDAARLELEQAGPPARPPLELVSLLVAFLRGAELVPVARLRTRREVVRAEGAEIVDDLVAVLSGPRVTRRFRELEVELVGGDEHTLRRLEQKLRKAGASSGEQRPKLFRALDLDVPELASRVPKDASSTEALGITLAEHARRVLLHDPGTRLGSDPEELHKLRVSTRRLRAYLRAAKPLLDPTWTKELRDELGWLGRSLGPARDLDVLVAYVSGELEALGDDADAGAGLLAELADEHARARHQVVEALSSDRYLALLDRLDEIGTPALSGEQVPLAKLWRREWKRASKALAGLSDESTDEELHAARIKVKRARYAAELAAHELGKDGERFADVAARLQDVLGEHQDASVAEERIRAWGERSRGVTAGLLVRRQHDRRAEARAELPKATKQLRRAAKPLA